MTDLPRAAAAGAREAARVRSIILCSLARLMAARAIPALRIGRHKRTEHDTR